MAILKRSNTLMAFAVKFAEMFAHHLRPRRRLRGASHAMHETEIRNMIRVME